MCNMRANTAPWKNSNSLAILFRGSQKSNVPLVLVEHSRPSFVVVKDIDVMNGIGVFALFQLRLADKSFRTSDGGFVDFARFVGIPCNGFRTMNRNRVRAGG